MAGDVNVATLVATLEAKTKEFDRAIKGSERRLDQLEKNTKSAGRGMEKFGKLLKGVAALGAIKLGADLFKLGVQAEAWGRRYETVFGSATGVMDEFVSTMNTRFGVAEERLKGTAAAVGDLVRPMGFTRQETAEFSKEVLTLSGALNEWTGGVKGVDEVSQILTKSLLGERDALVSLGLKISSEQINAELLARGMDELTGAAKRQAEAQITLELITGQSADAMAAFEEGQTDAQAASTNMSTALDDLRIKVGELLIKLAPLVSFLADLLGLIEQVGEQFTPSIAALDALRASAGRTRPRLREAELALAEMASVADKKFFPAMEAAAEGVELAADELERLRDELKKLTDPIFAAASANQELAETFARIDEDGQRTADELLELAGAVINMQSAMGAFESGDLQAQMDAMAAATGLTADAVAELFRQLGLLDGTSVDFTINGSAPPLSLVPERLPGGTGGPRAAGGPVNAGMSHLVGERGPEMFVPSQNGTIIPNNGLGGGGGVTVIVEGSVISEGDLVEAVRRGLRSDTIRGGSLEFA